jgi:predicted negative regulator of RcsB-dependent stress response
MAAYDLEEQEQLATLKAWWAENGSLVTTTLSLVLILFAAWQGWNYYQRNQAAQASMLYETVQKAARAGDLKQVRESAGAILEQYPRTAYAAMAALVSAKAHFQGGDLKTAHAQLAWVAENAKDEGLQDIARVRLASVMLDEKAYDDALKALEAKHGAAFKSALEKADAKDAGLRGSIQLRLDALGAAK